MRVGHCIQPSISQSAVFLGLLCLPLTSFNHILICHTFFFSSNHIYMRAVGKTQIFSIYVCLCLCLFSRNRKYIFRKKKNVCFKWTEQTDCILLRKLVLLLLEHLAVLHTHIGICVLSVSLTSSSPKLQLTFISSQLVSCSCDDF